MAVRESVTPTNDLSGTSHVVDLPATVASGDLLVVVHTHFGNESSPASLDGWTPLISHTTTAFNGAMQWARVADGTEGGGTVTIELSGAVAGSAQVLRVTGWHGTILGGCEASTPATAGSGTPNPSSITPTWGAEADTLFFAVGHMGDDDATATAPPTGYGNLVNATSGGGQNNSGSTATASRTATTGTEDPDAFETTQSEGWIANTIAIRPGDSGGGGGGTTTRNANDTGLFSASATRNIVGVEEATEASAEDDARFTDSVDFTVDIGLQDGNVTFSDSATLQTIGADVVLSRDGDETTVFTDSATRTFIEDLDLDGDAAVSALFQDSASYNIPGAGGDDGVGQFVEFFRKYVLGRGRLTDTDMIDGYGFVH